MERALSLESLGEALGDHPAEVSSLPTVEELQALMADTEVRLFTGRAAVSEDLLQAGWYLHGVASAATRFELYDKPRQRRAFQISAHIFDLALAEDRWNQTERFRFAFAAEIGYHRGELQPNAMAIWRRVEALASSSGVLDHFPTVALEAGTAFLGQDRRRVMDLIRGWRAAFGTLRRQLELQSLDETMFAAPNAVVDAVDGLMQYLAFGNTRALGRARERLQYAVDSPASFGDLDARWVAAHLLAVSDQMERGSIWSLLPPELPNAAHQALTLTDPPVLALWEPQRELLTAQPQPLDSATRRVVMSVPTSAGKTLLAQLFMVCHLAAETNSVCYVAPMRSLGREVRRSMRSRLRPLQRELGRDMPDFFPEGLFDLSELLQRLAGMLEQPPDVDIVTPERLAHLLREDADQVLNRYGLFIFDEAHLLGEQGRGFTLEAVLSFLHWRTRETAHRIVLLSAAFGNRGQLMSWLDPEGQGLLFESEWRGPRRLNAVFTTRIDWREHREETVRSPSRPLRRLYPLFGDIRLRPAATASVQHLQLVQPVGEVAFRVTADGTEERTRESDKSTPMYRAVARLAVAISHGGPVMVVTSTRADARRMARAIADQLPPAPEARAATEFARLRLGEDHPLVEVLARGVAYHHAAIPVDVLETVEDAVRGDQVRFIASTTSLTEGVNLPVRAVVLAETRYEDQPTDALLHGARLLNAMGRAGRACKECEGWVVLVENRRPDEADFELMAVSQEELAVESRLTDTTVLEAASVFDDAMRERDDALFELAADELGDFVSFVWFILAAEEAAGRPPDAADLDGLLSSTLAFIQLNPPDRDRWTRIANGVRGVYQRTPESNRRRWARTGTTVGSARTLATLASQLAQIARQREGVGEATTALALLDEVGAIRRLLELPEAPRRWQFRRSPGGHIVEIEVEPSELLARWIRGDSIASLALDFLPEVTAPDFRIEQMVDAVTQHFEHFLAWMVGSLLALANTQLAELNEDDLICPPLPLFIRYGVDSVQALELLVSGIRSREFAKAAGDVARLAEIEPENMRSWLRGMSIAEWRTNLGAAAADVLDLLEYVRARRSCLLRMLLENGEVTVELDDAAGVDADDVVIASVVGEPPVPLIVDDGEGQTMGWIPTGVHSEVEAILETGLALRLSVSESTLRIRLDREDSEDQSDNLP